MLKHKIVIELQRESDLKNAVENAHVVKSELERQTIKLECR